MEHQGTIKILKSKSRVYARREYWVCVGIIIIIYIHITCSYTYNALLFYIDLFWPNYDSIKVSILFLIFKKVSALIDFKTIHTHKGLFITEEMYGFWDTYPAVILY